MKTVNSSPLPLLIRGGHIIDPGQDIDWIGDILILEGRIKQVKKGQIPVLPGQVVVDASGLIVSPGFVDLHCHLRDPGFEGNETIATGTKAAARGGFTTVCCMANTNPPLDNRATIDYVRQKARKEGCVNVLPIGCVTRGRAGREICDMAELADAGVVAFSDDGDSVSNSLLMRQALDRGRGLGLPIIDHCEDKALASNGVINEGSISRMLGLKGIPAAAEEIIVARDIALARLTGARVHLAHVSTRESVELIRHAKEENLAVTAEATPHHLTLTEERVVHGEWSRNSDAAATKEKQLRYDTSAKVNPPLRTQQDVEHLIGGLKDGLIDAIATDHAPHSLADKECNMDMAAFGISGFETALGCLMRLVHGGKISLPTLLSRLTCAPAKIIGKSSELGTLKEGVPASIAIFDPNREWRVAAHDFVSRGKNTPFDGCSFKGKVVATMVNGRLVYLDNSLTTARNAYLRNLSHGE
ncbi:MAG: dihydroorotase [Dehalococcoidia bacterium]|nr:dihydroorotase [Dehalococcoidia bacterium]